jgi:hypothetical protein
MKVDLDIFHKRRFRQAIFLRQHFSMDQASGKHLRKNWVGIFIYRRLEAYTVEV